MEGFYTGDAMIREHHREDAMLNGCVNGEGRGILGS